MSNLSEFQHHMQVCGYNDCHNVPFGLRWFGRVDCILGSFCNWIFNCAKKKRWLPQRFGEWWLWGGLTVRHGDGKNMLYMTKWPREEVPITAPGEVSCQIWRSTRWCNFFLYRKIQIMGTAKFWLILFLKLKLLWYFEAKSWPEHVINV